MTTEEKAKAYDEALRKAKKLYEQGTITEILSYVFPELAESEDERIRKNLIKIVKQNYPNDDVSKYIAWLEKQGESYTKKDVDDAWLKGICDAKRELEKQAEQKPADNAEQKFKENLTIKKSIMQKIMFNDKF